MNAFRLCHRGYTPRHERRINLRAVAYLHLNGEGVDTLDDGLFVRCYSHQGSLRYLYFVKRENDVPFSNEKGVVYKLDTEAAAAAQCCCRTGGKGGDRCDDAFTIERVEWDIDHPYIDTYIFYKE
uniref:Uncharacterized protein n=1 Tax=Panulirus argus virus 1 TaxID=380624 RepID=A0A6G9HE70_9VIRU|nr:hypothetical protein [Panulirus argus virus 1]